VPVPVLVLLVALGALAPSGFGYLLWRAGLRAGDRPGELAVAAVEQGDEGDALIVWLRNAGRLPVVVGLSVGRPTLRVRLDGGLTVRAPRRTLATRRLGTRHPVVGVVPAGALVSFAVPIGPACPGRLALTVCAGQDRRLRVIERMVRILPRSGLCAVPPPVYISAGHAGSYRPDRSHC
jgi:hypothetical protein